MRSSERVRAFGVSLLSLLAMAVLPWTGTSTVFAGESVTAVAAGSLVGGLPKDTVFLLRVANAKALLQKVEKSPIYRLKDHPDVKDLVTELGQKVDQGMSEAKAKLGFDPKDLVSGLQGEMIIAVGGLDAVAAKVGEALSMGEAPEMSPESLPFVIAAEAGSSGAQVRECMEKLFAFAVKEGAKRETKEVKGGKITTIFDAESETKAPAPKANTGSGSLDDDDAGVGSEPEVGTSSQDVKLYFGEAGTRFYFATSRSFLEATMAGGSGESLGSHPLYVETQRVIGEGDISFYVNVKQFTTSLGNALSATFVAFFWQKIEALTFGKSLNTMGGTIALEDTGIRQTFFVHNAGASDGILGLLKGKPFSSTPSEMVPASTGSYTALSFNPPQLQLMIQEIAQVAASFGQPVGDIEALSKQYLGVSMKDLMGSLGERIQIFAKDPNMDNPFANMTLLLDLKDEAPLKSILGRFSSGPQATLKSEKYKDGELFVMPLPAGETAISVSQKTFYLGGSKSDLQSLLDRTTIGGSGLAASEGFKKLASSVPATVSMLSYGSRDYTKKSFDNMLQTLGSVGDADAKRFASAAAALGEVLGESIGYGVWRENGLYSAGMTLYR